MTRNQRLTGSSISTAGLAAIIVIAVVVLLARVGSDVGARPTPSADPSQVAQVSPGPSDSPEPSSAEPSSAPSSQEPTTTPEATISGEGPGPDATVPPEVAIIPGIGIQDIAGLAASFGLTCQSRAGGIGGSEGGFNVHCDGTAGNPPADVVVEAVYWTADGVQTLSVSFVPATDQPLDETTAANNWILPFASFAGGDATAWVQGHIGDKTCSGGCVLPVPGGNLSYYSGSRGAQELLLIAGPGS
jgi:hypothetical protein